jgi:ABC-type branched-subunit amino acid transport system ATPase component
MTGVGTMLDAPSTERGSGLLEVRNVSCAFGGVRAVDGVSLSVAEGRITGLIGPNGAGKSTLLNLIAGSLGSQSGEIWLDGEQVTGCHAHALARLGMIRTFQLSNLFPHMTVMENMLIGAGRGEHDALWRAFSHRSSWRGLQEGALARARELLAAFGLGELEDNYGAELSGGQKRIVEILRALMARPRLLLLDEPFAGLSPRIVDQMVEYLRGVSRDGVTMLLVEHELHAVELMCDTVVVMAQGSVLAQGDMASLRANEEVQRAYLS